MKGGGYSFGYIKALIAKVISLWNCEGRELLVGTI